MIMAKETQARSALFLFLSLLLLLLLLLLTHLKTADAHRHGSIAVYWSPPVDGNLTAVCATGRYSYVNIAFLNGFGNGQTPQPNLAAVRNPATNGSTISSDQIRYCQSKGIKVMLSIGGVLGDYSLSSKSDAKNFSRYLWNNYLGGRSSNRPFGSAVLDGIDFYILHGSAEPDMYWDDLVRYLHNYGKRGRKKKKKKVYLSAAPGCNYPDDHLGKALQTGLFDFVWLQNYYQDYDTSPDTLWCMYFYPNNATILFDSWALWIKSVKARKFFLGLVAVPNPGTLDLPFGFIPVDVLKSQILPVLKNSTKYGGVMIFNAEYDAESGYSADILSSVR